MGNDLDTGLRDEISLVPWLDARTGEFVCALIDSLTQMYPEIVAIILFGSLARHDERPLTHHEPSDVDLLALVDPHVLERYEDLPLEREVAIWMSYGAVEDRYRDAPRDVQMTLALSDLAGWDESFVENVARDGILLWARDTTALPDVLVSRSPTRLGTNLSYSLPTS